MVINVDTRQMLAKGTCKLNPCPFPLCTGRVSQPFCLLRRDESLEGLKLGRSSKATVGTK